MKPRLFANTAVLLALASLGQLPLPSWAQSPAHETQVTRGAPARVSAHLPDQPFAFRGIALGITLDEFRTGSTVRATPVGSVPVCETDVMAGELGMNLKSADSLTVACRWAHRDEHGWKRSQAVVDGALAEDHVLRFTRTNGQAPFRLYEISFVVDEVTAGDLREALADRYGSPRLVTRSGPQEEAVAPTYVWENARSSITLCFLPATHNATLTYLLKSPDAWVKSVVRQWQASSPDAG
jgi:hypothetical protein